MSAPIAWKRKPPLCEAGVTPCGAPALLYPCGWRCDTHSPAAVRTGTAIPAKTEAVGP